MQGSSSSMEGFEASTKETVLLWEIVRREILDQVTGARLWLASALVVVVMVMGGIVFNGRYDVLLSDYNEDVNTNVDRFRSASNDLEKLAHYTQTLYAVPNPLSFCVEGSQKDLPNAFKANIFRIEGPENLQRSNRRISQFSNLDWAFLIAVFMSFVALMLTYGTLSGEKTSGTLSLTLSNPVPRGVVLVGKYTSALIAVLVPLSIGVLINLLIVLLGGNVSFGFAEWLRVVLVLVTSILYLSLFILIGLFVSALTSRPATSLIILLALWIVLVIVIPNTGAVIASGFYKVPAYSEYMERRYTVSGEIWDSTPEGHDFDAGWRERPPPAPRAAQIRAEMFQKIEAEQSKVDQWYRGKILAQAKLARKVTCLSPTALYQQACEEIVGVGFPKLGYFLEEVRRYRDDLKKSIADKDRADPSSHHLIYFSWEGLMSHKTVEFDAVPKFVDRPLTLTESLQKSLGSMALLVIFNVILFFGAYIAFLKYDVR